MKRLFALLLAVAMLLSLCVLPASAAEQSKMSVDSFYTFTKNEDNMGVTIGEPKTTFAAGDLVAVKATFHNAESDAIRLMSIEMFMEYDSSVLKPFFWVDEDDGTVYGYAVFADNFKMGEAAATEVEQGKKVKISGASGNGLKLNSGATVAVAYYLFEVKGNVEAGNIDFRLGLDELKKKGTAAGEADEIKDSVSLEEKTAPVTGNPPTLDYTTVSSKTAEYASGAKLTLGAKSLSGKDITGLVAFEVMKQQEDGTYADATGFTINGSELTVDTANPAAVGTYKVDVNLTNDKVTIPGAYTCAEFTIAPAKITNPTVTISFGKGVDVPTTATMSDGLTFGTIEWKGESGTKVESGKFAGSSTYTAVITFSADGNHQLAENSTVSVSGVDSQYVTGNQLTGPDSEGKYTLTLTLKTADKEAPTVTVNGALNATYGQTLSDIAGQLNTALTASVEGSFAWVQDGTTPVGPVNGNNQFEVRFTPTDSANYATATTMVTVNVAKKQITFNRADYAWRAMNDEQTVTQEGKGIVFTYDGQEHGIEPYCTNNSIKDFVQFEYDPAYNRHTSVNTIGATVKANVVAANENCEIVGDVKQLSGDWAILSKTINFDGEYTANVQACYSVTSHTVTLDKFGLPNEVTSDPNTRYTLRDNKVIVDNNVLDVNSVVYENGTLRFNLVSGLSDTAVNTKASIMFGLYVNNYKTNHAAVSGISTGTEANLFILKADITLIAKSTDAETMTVEVPNAEYGVGVTPKVTGKPDSVGALDFVYTNTETKQTYTQNTIMTAPAGEYTLTVTCEDNTTIYEATATFTITQRSIADATVTFTDLTYNGSEQTTDITVKLGEKTLTKDVDYTVTGDLKGTNAGEYTVTVNGTGNYTGELTAKFTIAKATPTAANFTFTAPANLTYDGSPKAASVTTTNTEIGAVTVSYDPAVPTNAGKYKVKISTAETKNHKPVTDLTADGWKVTIAPKPVTVTDIAAQDKTYDGTDTATITGTLTGVLEKDKANVTLNAPTATFASKNVNAQAIGTQKALPQAVTVAEGSKFTLSGSAADNYEISPEPDLTNLTATINFKTLALTEAQRNLTVDVRYTDLTEHSVSLPVPEGLIEGDVVTNVRISKSSDPYPYNRIEEPTYNSENGSIKFRLASETEETASVKYLISLNYGSNYYNTLNLTLYINISIRSAQSPLTYTGATSVVYGQSITLTSAGGSGTGAVTYAIVSGGDGAATISGNVLTATKAGTVKIQVTKAGDNDYLSTTSAVYDITVTKATPATPPEIKVDNTDTTLGELGNKMLFEIGVPGTINWYGPDGKPITDPHTKIEANTEYRWKFIPADPDNYNSIEGKTTPYVRDDLSWLPGVLGGGSSFSFHDVTRFDYYYDSVKWAADNGIASGTSRFTFSPDAVCTRAQTVTFLWRAAGSPLPRYRVSPFTDVHSYDYYYEAVLWAVEQGITTGLTATTFGPDETVTRGQVATFLYRAASAAKPNTFNPFTDVKPTAYNYGAILWAYDNRITTGTSTTTFSPDAFCTRAQIVTFLYRYYQGR